MSFEHPFFRKAPAMAALKDIKEPNPEHVRACLMEMARYMFALQIELEEKGFKFRREGMKSGSYRDDTPQEAWCVVVSVNDEPPKPPVITGVFGPFTEKEANDLVEVMRKVYYAKDTSFLITPLDRGNILDELEK